MSACSNSANSAGGGGSTVTVPVILPLTGAQSILGGENKQALQSLANEVNKEHLLKGGTLKLSFLDNQSTPSVAVSAAAPLVGQQAFIINGSVTNTQAAVNALVKSGNGPIVYNVSPAVYPDPDSYVFVGAADTADVAKVALKYMSSKNLTRVALISSTDPSGQDGKTAVQAGIKTTPGAQLVANESFNIADPSVNSQVAHVAAAKPQAIVLWTTGPQIGTVFQALRAQGLDNVPVFMSYGNISFGTMQKLADSVPTNLYSVGPSYMMTESDLDPNVQTQVKVLYSSLSKAAGQLDITPSFCDDGLLLYVDALNHLGLHANAQQVKNYIQGLTTWAGINGVYHFSKSDHRGLNDSDYGVVQYKKSTNLFSPVSPLGG
jgi:branched-chain amino acid transport system substrate-binding protein